MSTYYTSKYSGEQIDEAVRKILDGEMTGDYADRQLSNLDTPQGALANLGAGVRPSLLHNGLFIGGGTAGNLPVNQRGQTIYTVGGYTVDRWRMAGSAAKITVQADGIYYEKTADATSYGIWEQKLPLGKLEGKELTASVLVDDVCHSDTIAAGWTYSNGTTLKQFFINNGSKQLMISIICDADNILIFRFYYGGSAAAATTGFLLQAAKLEEGDTQTLAYQDDTGAWQLLPQPESDYATQLAKCQRYQLSLPYGASQNYAPIGFGWAQTASSIRILIPTPVTMRANPVVSYLSGDISGISLICNGKVVGPTAISHIDVQNYGVAIEFAVSDATANMPCVMRMTSAYMMLDANL